MKETKATAIDRSQISEEEKCKEVVGQVTTSMKESSIPKPTQALPDIPKPVEATAPTSCNPITGQGMISKKDLFFADFAKESNPVTETEIAQDLSEKEDIKLTMTRDEMEAAHETYLMNAFAQAKTTTQNHTKGL